MPAYSQRDETILRNPSLKLTGIWGGSVGRIHNFTASNQYSHGGFFTFEFNKDYMIGWDGYTVNSYDEGFGDIKVETDGLLLGYAYNGFQVVHPVAYLSVGRAKTRADGFSTVKSFAALGSVGAELNIFRWFRIGGEVGYRYIDNENNAWMKDANLSEPYAGIKLKFGWSWGK